MTPEEVTTLGSVSEPADTTTTEEALLDIVTSVNDPSTVTTIVGTTSATPPESTTTANPADSTTSETELDEVTTLTPDSGDEKTMVTDSVEDQTETITTKKAMDDLEGPVDEMTKMKPARDDAETTTQAVKIDNEQQSTEEDRNIDSVTEAETTATTSQPESSTEPVALAEDKSSDGNELEEEENSGMEIILFPRDPLLKVTPTTGRPDSEVSTTVKLLDAVTELETTVADQQEVTESPIPVTETQDEETTLVPLGEVMADDVAEDYQEEEEEEEKLTTTISSQTLSESEETTVTPQDGTGAKIEKETSGSEITMMPPIAEDESAVTDRIEDVSNTTMSTSGSVDIVPDVTTESGSVEITTELVRTESEITTGVAKAEDIGEDGLTEGSGLQVMVTESTGRESDKTIVTTERDSESTEEEVDKETTSEPTILEGGSEKPAEDVTEGLFPAVSEGVTAAPVEENATETSQDDDIMESSEEITSKPMQEIVTEGVTGAPIEDVDDLEEFTEAPQEEGTTTGTEPAKNSDETVSGDTTTMLNVENNPAPTTTQESIEGVTEMVESENATDGETMEITSTTAP